MQIDFFFFLPLFKYSQFLQENAVNIALDLWTGKLEYDQRSEWSHHNRKREVGKVEGEVPVIQCSRGKDYCSAAEEQKWLHRLRKEFYLFYYVPVLLHLASGKAWHLLSSGECDLPLPFHSGISSSANPKPPDPALRLRWRLLQGSAMAKYRLCCGSVASLKQRLYLVRAP